MTDQKELLQKLVEAPYGKAEEILKSEGLWDEKRKPSDGTLRTFRVRVDGEIPVSAMVKVQATSIEEAEDLATDLANARGFDWQDYGEPQCIGAFVEDSRE